MELPTNKTSAAIAEASGAMLRFSLSYPPLFILQIKNYPQRGHGHFRFAASQQFII